MQKFTVTLILKTNKAKGSTDIEKEQSKIPIYLRIYIDGKRTYKATGHKIEEKYWDADKELIKSTYRNAQPVNDDLRLKKEEIVNDLVKQRVNGKVISVATAKQSLQPVKMTNIFTFVDWWTKTLVGLDDRKQGTLDNYKKHLLKLEQYHGSKNLDFEDITSTYLTNYTIALKEEVGNNYTHALIKTIRTFFNAAIREELITVYPFKGKYKFPKYVSPTKDYLTKEELQRWEELIPELKGTALYQTAIYFFFACYCGLRISDWYQFSEEKVYEHMIRMKAIKNNADITVPVNKPLQRAINMVTITPLTDREPKINEKLKTIAKKLKLRNKNGFKKITAHSARHTFAVTICLGNKLSSETAAKLMGITLKTFVAAYSQVGDEKIKRETDTAWSNLK